ncbi:hypothetical protein PENVUL_c002G04794 [Penicillium vulpinum]|uniref:Uncharacterized protein n=1 Tax=Penicillium vulpinum TaxID=29845 RepID=A0A1V6SCW9_9EURO|nr:hypothetical protein PENVUL_c002G04794 [Penicillium vulpinum]
MKLNYHFLFLLVCVLQLVTSDLPQLRKDLNQRPKKLEDSHSDLQEAKRVLHKRISTIKADLEKKVKVDVEEQVKSEIWEGILRHRRLPGKEWSKAEIERGEDTKRRSS